ncbi:hypothetical protein Tco_1002923 [Tanacetum coccineum]|uniref:Uncharacterized protein n=1 Tax=Tanacetum coccineum TaxID=301880 RepID=A0ABQ5F7Z0_9ASTR
MTNLPPPNDDPNIPEEEPVNPEPAPVVPNPASMQPNIVLNDIEEENMEEDLQENLKEEEKLEDDDDYMNDAELLPTIRRYSSDVYFGESSSSAAMRDVEHYRIGMEYYRDMA